MVSKTFTRIMERLDDLQKRLGPVMGMAQRLERMEAKLDQLAELLQAQNKPATPTKAADKK